MSDSLEISVERGVARVAFNRTAMHNAFDAALITDLIDALVGFARDPKVRCLVLTGNGASFSAGADLNWMRDMAKATEQENREDSQKLSMLMRLLNYLPKPTIARVNGAAYGGGVGIVACCAIAIAADTAKFGLTEVKLGLIPAVISPYVICAIGERHAQRLFLTGEIFDAAYAARIGLVHEIVPSEKLDETIDRMIHLLSKGGPNAQREAKELIFHAGSRLDAISERDAKNAALIARLRVSAEGQEGLTAFLDKRPPSWVVATE
jgi:methylglutaconyl-CoA hydratase